MAKTALVISGGGSKGAFAAGIIKRLSEEQPDLSFDILVGTSTGALIVPLVAIDELDLLEELYTSVVTSDIVRTGNIGTRLLTDNSLYDAGPLAQLIKTNMDDAKCHRIFQATNEVYLATTCLQTEEAVYFSSKNRNFPSSYRILPLSNADQFRRAVMASACQPVFMPPIEIVPGSSPIRQFVDGGVREYAGVQLAIDAGAEEIFVILLSTGGNETVEIPFGNAFDILKRSLDIFITDVGDNDLKGPAIYNQALRYIENVKRNLREQGLAAPEVEQAFDVPGPFRGRKPLKIHMIRPNFPLGGGPGGLVFDPVEMRTMFSSGEMSISSYLASSAFSSGGNV